MVMKHLTGKGVFHGSTLPEHGLGKRGVSIIAPHYLTCAMTGAGKSTTSAYFRLLFLLGSMAVISPKPEYVEFALGYRTDPRLFHSHVQLPKGIRRGCDPRGITKVKYHLPNGTCFNFDPGHQTSYECSGYRMLNDVHIEKPGAIGRLFALAAGSFPDNPLAREQWWIKGPKAAIAATWAHFLSSSKNSDHHTMPYCLRRLLGIDPLTGVADPQNQEKLFQEMMRNPALNGWIQTVACSLYQLGVNNFGALNAELMTNAGWMLDPSMQEVLTKEPSFSLDYLGHDGWPVTAFFTLPRAEKAANAWLRSVFELMQLVLQQQEHVPSYPTAIICDELKFWGRDVSSTKDSLNVMRDRNVALHLYTQSYGQLVDMYSEAGAAEVLSACCLQVFGCNDVCTRRMIREKLGQTAYHHGKSSTTVDLLSDDAIERYLSRSSPLQLVLPPDTPPMMLGRLAYKSLRTKEGTYYEGLPLKGYYDDHFDR